MKSPSEKNRALQNAKKSKTTKKKSFETRPSKKPRISSTQRTQTSGIFVKQVVFLTVNHRGPLPLRELYSTGETIVWKDPGGPWACLPPVYDCVWNHPATGCHMWTTPKKHTKRRETLGNAKQNKTTRRTGYKVYGKKTPKKAFRIKDRDLWNAEQNKKH